MGRIDCITNQSCSSVLFGANLVASVNTRYERHDSDYEQQNLYMEMKR